MPHNRNKLYVGGRFEKKSHKSRVFPHQFNLKITELELISTVANIILTSGLLLGNLRTINLKA